MFTGIVEALGEIREVEEGPGLRSFRIAAPPAFLLGTKPGASIAVDGACLTPVTIAEESFSVQAVMSTLSRTVAGEYRAGRMVNLERPLAFGGRVDGHLVQGHVDGIGHLIRVRGEGGLRTLEASIPGRVHRLTLLHGSIALNGGEPHSQPDRAPGPHTGRNHSSYLGSDESPLPRVRGCDERRGGPDRQIRG